MGDLKDYLNSINYTKEDLMGEGEVTGVAVSQYKPFVINRCLSGFTDTILFANEMNYYHGLPKQSQYHFYLTAIRPRKRFAPWIKAESDEYVPVVQEYFKCSIGKAREYLKILSNNDLQNIKNQLDKGGRSNERSSKHVTGSKT